MGSSDPCIAGGEEEREDEELGSDEEAGQRRCVRVQDPKLPSKEEVEEHNLTHLPYRSWCRHCVRGRGKGLPHKRSTEEPVMHEFHFDWAFPGDEGEEETLKVLVGRMRGEKMTMSSVHPTKTTGEFIAKRVLAFIRECGCEMVDITVKTDQEPVIMTMVENLARERAKKGAMRMVIEHAPKYQSQSNGVVERAVQSVVAQMRVIRSSLEERMKVKIGSKHAVWAWVAEYASYLLNRFEVGKDGKTAYERCKGKRAKVMGLEFGEGILWKRRAVGGKLAKLSCMWEAGIFLGVKGTTGEIIVGDNAGIHRTRSIQRKPLEERWNKEHLKMVTGVPWKKSEDDPEVDGEGMECRDLTAEEAERLTEEKNWKDAVPRRFSIRKQDIKDHRMTVGCPGCEAAARGKPKRKHSEECRKRFEEAMKGEERLKASKARIDEYVTKRVKEMCKAKGWVKESEEEGEEEELEAKKRSAEGEGDEVEAKKRKEEEKDREAKRVREEQVKAESEGGAAEESEEKRRKRQLEERSRTEEEARPEVKRGAERTENEEDEAKMKKIKKGDEGKKRERKGSEDEGGSEEEQDRKRQVVEEVEVMHVNEEEAEEEEWAFDDVDGRPIDAKLVKEARKERWRS